MTTKYTYKEIWIIAYPILISLIMEQLIGMTDTAFLGRVGEVELGASGHCRCILSGYFYDGIRIQYRCTNPGIARRNGEQQYQAIGPIFYQGVYFLLSLAVVAFTLSLCFSPHILKKVISSEHIYDASISYINWRSSAFSSPLSE